MKVVILAGCVALVSVGLQNGEAASEQTGVLVWVSNPLIKVFKDTLPPQSPTAQEVSIVACRNEYEPAQICVSSYDYQGPVRVRVSPLDHVSGHYTISTVDSRFVGYVSVGNNNRYFTPLRKAPAFFPDPLILDEQVELKPAKTQPVWISSS